MVRERVRYRPPGRIVRSVGQATTGQLIATGIGDACEHLIVRGYRMCSSDYLLYMQPPGRLRLGDLYRAALFLGT